VRRAREGQRWCSQTEPEPWNEFAEKAARQVACRLGMAPSPHIAPGRPGSPRPVSQQAEAERPPEANVAALLNARLAGEA
jgi:hypothetical protein